jgi:hypothetical protein
MFSLQKAALIFVVYLVDHIVRCKKERKKELTRQNIFLGSYKMEEIWNSLKGTHPSEIRADFYVGEEG